MAWDFLLRTEEARPKECHSSSGEELGGLMSGQAWNQKPPDPAYFEGVVLKVLAQTLKIIIH